MILWRISNHADLKGIGALRLMVNGHQPVVYLAEHPAPAFFGGSCSPRSVENGGPDAPTLRAPVSWGQRRIAAPSLPAVRRGRTAKKVR